MKKEAASQEVSLFLYLFASSMPYAWKKHRHNRGRL